MYGVIDIGSNTIRLVLYRVDEQGIHQMLNSKEAAGLVGYIDRKGRMSEQGARKAVEVLNEFKSALSSVTLEELYVFATASLRNITNTEEIVEQIRLGTGFRVRVLTGDEEAVFDYFGAIKSFTVREGLLVDIGGGSTELVFFAGGEVAATYSIPVGSLNMFTKYVKNLIPGREELEQIRQGVRQQLESLRLPVQVNTEAICGVGGSARACCKLHDELYDLHCGYGGFEAQTVKKMVRLTYQKRDKLLSAMIKVAPDRLHTLPSGMCILQTIIEFYGCKSFAVSPYGVREGYLMYMLEGGTQL